MDNNEYRERTGQELDSELREAERKINDICEGCSLCGGNERELTDYIDLAIAKAVERAVQEGKGINGGNAQSTGIERRQSTVVPVQIERQPYPGIAWKRKNHTRFQWSGSDH